MRELTDRERLARFMRALGEAANEDARVYFTGGATAVLQVSCSVIRQSTLRRLAGVFEQFSDEPR